MIQIIVDQKYSLMNYGFDVHWLQRQRSRLLRIFDVHCILPLHGISLLSGYGFWYEGHLLRQVKVTIKLYFRSFKISECFLRG